MNRPYMICHILSALNGKISGSFMGAESNRQMGREYAAIRNAYQADAWLYGTTTTKEFTGFRVPVYSPKDYTVPAGDFIAKKDAELYYVSIDTEGEIGWESGTCRRAGCPDAHVIEVVTGSTPVSYLAYLRKHGVSYIMAGEKSLDCQIAVKKLYQLFGIRRVLICGGGAVNWSFLQQGVVDELSLLLSPSADGENDTPSIFENSSYLQASAPVEFNLEDVQRIGKNGLRLVYSVPQKMER